MSVCLCCGLCCNMLILAGSILIVQLIGLSMSEDCPAPKVPNGVFDILSFYSREPRPTDSSLITEFPPGSVLEFSCDRGYKLIGTPQRYCIENGTWTGDTVKCEELTCPEPEQTEHATYHYHDRKYRSKVYYSCADGFRIRGRRIRRCRRNLQWSGSPPVCLPEPTCVDPGHPENGQRAGECCTIGSALQYKCNEGYFLNGRPKIRCTGDGHWDFPPPRCRVPGACRDPGNLENGERTITRWSNHWKTTGLFHGGDVARFSCVPGHYLDTYEEFVELKCLNSGYWSDDISYYYCRELLCDLPWLPYNGGIVEAANRNKTSFSAGETIHYYCDHGYQLHGNKERECNIRSDGWTGRDPLCRPIRCPDPGWPENGRRIGNARHMMGKVLFACFAGYTLRGSETRTCMPNGEWSGTLTTCDKGDAACPDPGIPIGGIKIGKKYNIGDRVTFRCKPGLVLHGTSERICQQNGTWSGKEVTCKDPNVTIISKDELNI